MCGDAIESGSVLITEMLKFYFSGSLGYLIGFLWKFSIPKGGVGGGLVEIWGFRVFDDFALGLYKHNVHVCVPSPCNSSQSYPYGVFQRAAVESMQRHANTKRNEV